MKRFIAICFVLLIASLVGIFLWWEISLMAVNGDIKVKAFSVINGEGVRLIANDLHNQGLIRNAFAFELLARQQSLGNKIQAGVFYLSPSMDAQTIANKLQKGSADIRITIPEGKRAQEIADTLQENFPTYQDNWRTQLIDNEGYLFPDTYYFNKDATIDTVIETLRANFDKKYASIPDGTTTLTKEEIVIIASMVEREAKFPEDRPLVASVILNRLRIGMALQVDATIQYALGYQPVEQTWWKKTVSTYDLKLDSPYNTYVGVGLPPTPISNPGLAALTAVLDAPHTNYIYYVSDKSGHNHYEETLDQHNADIRRYGL